MIQWKKGHTVSTLSHVQYTVDAHLRAHAHVSNEHKHSSNPLCSLAPISHIPTTSTLRPWWMKKVFWKWINSGCWRQNINLYFSKLTILSIYLWSCSLQCCSALVMFYTQRWAACSWLLVGVVRGSGCFMQWFAATQLKQMFAVYQIHLVENRNSLNSSSKQLVIGCPFCFSLCGHIIAETVWCCENPFSSNWCSLYIFCHKSPD